MHYPLLSLEKDAPRTAYHTSVPVANSVSLVVHLLERIIMRVPQHPTLVGRHNESSRAESEVAEFSQLDEDVKVGRTRHCVYSGSTISQMTTVVGGPQTYGPR